MAGLVPVFSFLRPIAVPLALLALVAGGAWVFLWLAFAHHSFGAFDPRVLLMVRGSLTEQIAVVDPEWNSRWYEAEAADGPGVGSLVTTYRTRASADTVLSTFLAGCARIGLAVRPWPADQPPPGRPTAACQKGDLIISIAVEGNAVTVGEDVF